jgi:hypothetical protein
VWTWPRTDRPALWVWSGGRWRWAEVTAKQVWADGSTYYRVAVDLNGDTSVTSQLYKWPQPGLRLAHVSRSKPTTGVDETRQGGMPRRPGGAGGSTSNPTM